MEDKISKQLIRDIESREPAEDGCTLLVVATENTRVLNLYDEISLLVGNLHPTSIMQISSLILYMGFFTLSCKNYEEANHFVQKGLRTSLRVVLT